MQGTKKSTRRQTYYQKFSREKKSIETKIRSRNLSRFLSRETSMDRCLPLNRSKLGRARQQPERKFYFSSQRRPSSIVPSTSRWTLLLFPHIVAHISVGGERSVISSVIQRGYFSCQGLPIVKSTRKKRGRQLSKAVVKHLQMVESVYTNTTGHCPLDKEGRNNNSTWKSNIFFPIL